MLEGRPDWGARVFIVTWANRWTSAAALGSSTTIRLTRSRIVQRSLRTLGSALSAGRSIQGEDLVRDTLGNRYVNTASQPRPEELEDFAAAGIESVEDIKRRWVDSFFFGSESDDRTVAHAFNDRANPLNVKINAIYSSDVGHWDVPDLTHVLAESWALVEKARSPKPTSRPGRSANRTSCTLKPTRVLPRHQIERSEAHQAEAADEGLGQAVFGPHGPTRHADHDGSDELRDHCVADPRRDRTRVDAGINVIDTAKVTLRTHEECVCSAEKKSACVSARARAQRARQCAHGRSPEPTQAQQPESSLVEQVEASLGVCKTIVSTGYQIHSAANQNRSTRLAWRSARHPAWPTGSPLHRHDTFALGGQVVEAPGSERYGQTARHEKPPYNLLDRRIEASDPCAQTSAWGSSWSPSRRLLTGNTRAKGHERRKVLGPQASARKRMLTARSAAAVKKLTGSRAEKGIHASQLARAWALQQPRNIQRDIGPPRASIFSDNLAALELSCT